MEISQHIKNLLKTNERVILAGFGAFSTKQISASIDKETKVMRPPFKIVVFDQNITEDAGLLVKYMSDQERISPENAREQIEEYIKTVKSKLAAGKDVEFKDLGSFKQSADGNIDFSFLTDDNLLLDSFGLPVVSISEQSISTTPPVEQKKPIKKAPPEKKVVKEQQKKQPVKKTPPVKKEKPVKTKSSSDKPKKKRKWLTLVIILAAIGLILTAIYFFKPDYWEKGYSFSIAKLTIAKEKIAGLFNGDDSGKYDVITEVVTETDNEAVDTASTEDIYTDVNESETDNEIEANTDINETTENVVVNESTNLGQNGKYYIIVGSVVSQSAAQNEQNRFSGKGINTDIIHVPNINRYRLSIGSFETAKKAQNYFEEFQSKHGNISAWVWEKK